MSKWKLNKFGTESRILCGYKKTVYLYGKISRERELRLRERCFKLGPVCVRGFGANER
jgi:hypothetical protein